MMVLCKGDIVLVNFNPAKGGEIGKLHYTNPIIRAIYRNLQTNIPYLFIYKNCKNLSISNTINALECEVFSHIKNMISLHLGLSKNLKLNLVDYYLVKLTLKCNYIIIT